MKNTRFIVGVTAFAAAFNCANAALVMNTTSVALDFNNLNTNYGGSYNSTGGSSLFPTSSTTTTIYSGAGGVEFESNYNDNTPGGVYSNNSTYSNSNSMRALQDGSSSDYAIGMKNSADQTMTLTLQNNTGMTISSWNVAYAIEQYSRGGSATVMSFSYSLNGTSFITTNLSGAADVSANNSVPLDVNFSAVSSTSRMGIVAEPIANGDLIYFRWTYDHQSGTSAYIGLDDITVTAVPEPASALLGTLSFITLLCRRRR